MLTREHVVIVLAAIILAGCTANARFDVSGKPADEPPPTSAAGWSARKPKSELGGTVIVVREGDTLSGIASRFGVTVPMLYTANGLLHDRLVPGQELVIPAKP